MAERIEKISASKKVTFDVEQYGSKRRFVDDNGESFRHELKKNLEKKDDKEENKDEGSEPYVVNISRATQSLFYEDDSTVKEIIKEINEN
jgi:hypothetical protein